MFHCLAKCCADLLIGGTGADRSDPAWRQVYRALEHGAASRACKDNETLKKFPKDIEDFGNMFVTTQLKRHAADYDPRGMLFKSAVIQDINEVEDVVGRFLKQSKRDKRAFAAFVLFKRRG